MNKEILIPSYYEKFSCIGSACEDTCCAGWRVTVDKQSFQNYRKIKSGPLVADLKTNISRNRKNPSDLNYGKIKMDANGQCTFIQQDGLCKIQKELGAESLCITCAIYPRKITHIEQRTEKSLVASCPEAARLILLNPEGIDFIIAEEEVKTSYQKQPVAVHDNFWDIRMFTIRVLQTRYASLEERLIVLGLFFEKLHNIPQEKWHTELPPLMTRYEQLIQDKSQLAQIAGLPTNLVFQMDLVNKLLGLRSSKGVTNKRYIECINDTANGLQMVAEGSIQRSITLYKAAEEKIYTPFLATHSYLLENYFVNYIFSQAFPVNTSNLYEQYVKLVLHFMLIKLLLIGMASHHQHLSIELVVKCIQSFAKTFEHDSKFLNDVLQDLQDKNSISMAHMIVLIKS